MNPSCKLPCYMNSSNSKMLQIPLKQQLPAPKCYKYVAKSMENEMVQLQNAAKTFEMAASSSKMLQLARKTCRKKRFQKKIYRNGKKHNSQNNSGPFCFAKTTGFYMSHVSIAREPPERDFNRAERWTTVGAIRLDLHSGAAVQVGLF